jgi:hypothetical protein
MRDEDLKALERDVKMTPFRNLFSGQSSSAKFRLGGQRMAVR